MYHRCWNRQRYKHDIDAIFCKLHRVRQLGYRDRERFPGLLDFWFDTSTRRRPFHQLLGNLGLFIGSKLLFDGWSGISGRMVKEPFLCLPCITERLDRSNQFLKRRNFSVQRYCYDRRVFCQIGILRRELADRQRQRKREQKFSSFFFVFRTWLLIEALMFWLKIFEL